MLYEGDKVVNATARSSEGGPVEARGLLSSSLPSIDCFSIDIKGHSILSFRYGKEILHSGADRSNEQMKKDIYIHIAFYKCKVLYMGSKFVKSEYELSKKEIKKVKEECNQWVGF